MKSLALGVALLLASVASAAAEPTPAPAPVPPATPVPSPPAAAPSTPATQTPGAAPPAASPAATAIPAPTPAYNFVYRATPSPATAAVPAPNGPQINEIDLSDVTIVTPGAIHVRVLTSTAVTSVVAQTFGRSIAIPQRASGLFALDANISAVPAFLRGRSYAIDFVASVADGRTANVTLPLVLK